MHYPSQSMCCFRGVSSESNEQQLFIRIVKCTCTLKAQTCRLHDSFTSRQPGLWTMETEGLLPVCLWHKHTHTYTHSDVAVHTNIMQIIYISTKHTIIYCCNVEEPKPNDLTLSYLYSEIKGSWILNMNSLRCRSLSPCMLPCAVTVMDTFV